MKNYLDFILIFIMPVLFGLVMWLFWRWAAKKTWNRTMQGQTIDPSRFGPKSVWPEYSLRALGLHITRTTGRRKS